MLAESRSCPLNIALAKAMLHRVDAMPLRTVLTTLRPAVPLRSTGASRAIAGHPATCSLAVELSTRSCMRLSSSSSWCCLPRDDGRQRASEKLLAQRWPGAVFAFGILLRMASAGTGWGCSTC
jgi:hypothetical protein